MEDRYIRLVDTNVCGSKYCMMQEIKVSSKELAGDIMEKCMILIQRRKSTIGITEEVIAILTSAKKHYSARELANFFCMDQAVLVVNTVDPVV